MKILITREIFYPDSRGGGEKLAYEMAKWLKDAGHEVLVLTTGNPKIIEYDGIKTLRINVNRHLLNFAVPWFYRYAKNFDLIQTTTYNACLPSLIVGKMLNKPVVCLAIEVYNKKWFKIRGLIGGWISQLLERLQIKQNYDKIVFLTEEMRAVGLSIGIDPKRAKVIAPGIDFSKFKAGKKENFVLFVGNLTRRKGIDILIESAKKIPDVKFLVVGKADEFEKLGIDIPKNVKVCGFLPEEEKMELFSKASVFCLPSIGEGFGFVVVEAMASGCAIVSTLSLKYEGFRVEYGNIDQLTNAIRYLIDNPNVAGKMGKRNRELAEKFTWKNFAKELIKTYQEVIGK